MEDFKAQREARLLQSAIMNHELPVVKKENSELKDKLVQLEKELSLVNWYQTIMESGMDTKEVIEDYAHLQEELKDLKASSEKEINRLNKLLSLKK